MTKAKVNEEILAKVRKKGESGERIAVEYLDRKGFTIEEWHEGKPSNKAYDILAWKNGRKWAIEVKTGKSPQIKAKNFLKLLHMNMVEMIGLVLVAKGSPFLFTYNKHTWFGEKAKGTK